MSVTDIPGGASTASRTRIGTGRSLRSASGSGLLGGQRVGAAGVDDGDRAEQVVDGVADRRQPLLGQPVAGVGRHGLAQRAQHVLAQRAVYWVPVSPVRTSVVSAAVSPTAGR